MWQCQFRGMGAVMKDMKGQEWLVFSCHPHNGPQLQKVMWPHILKLQCLFPHLPVVSLCDRKSILVPNWTFIFSTQANRFQNLSISSKHANMSSM